MKLTLQYLKQHGACDEGIQFVVRNNLLNFPLDLVPLIQVDSYEYYQFMVWLYDKLDTAICYESEVEDFSTTLTHLIVQDKYGNNKYHRDSSGMEEFWTYDLCGNLTQYKKIITTNTKINNYCEFYTYDKFGNLLTFCDTHERKISNAYDIYGNLYYMVKNDIEYWKDYDKYGNCIQCHNSIGRVVKSKYDEYGNPISVRRYLKADLISGYDNKYDKYDNILYFGDIHGYKEWYEYDYFGNKISYRNSNGQQEKTIAKFYADWQLKSHAGLTIPFFEKG